MGAVLNSSAGRDFATLSLRVLKKDLDKGFDLFMEALRKPTFPDAEIRREMESTLAAIQAAEERPDVVAEKAFRKALFLAGPYSHMPEGTRESLGRISRADLLSFYSTHYQPGNSIFVVVGDVNLQEVKTRLVPRLESWQAGQVPRADFHASFAKGPKRVTIDRKLTQANMILGSPGISRDNPDYYAVTVMNYILGGGGFASRLLEEIRNKRGLAYSVTSFFESSKYPGSFQIVLQTKNSSAQEAIRLVRQQLERIQKEGISAKELEAAKRYLVGSFPLRFDTQAKVANFLAQAEFFGLGPDYVNRYPSLIRQVTLEDVLRVARTYLKPQELILVVVADLKEAGLE